jgi:integrase
MTLMASRRRHFGSVRKLPSGYWQASYWHRAARHVAPRTFPTKLEALGWLAAVETAVRRGEWLDPAGGRLSVEELAVAWLGADPSKRASTRARDETIVRLHVVPPMGRTRIAEVTPPEIQAPVNSWCPSRAPRTVSRQYYVVRAIFAYAVRSELIARSPCRGIKLPAPAGRVGHALAPADVVAIAASVDESYRPMVWLGALLGLRWGEAAGLTRGAVDLGQSTLTVDRQLGRDGRLGPPKSAAGTRTCALPSALAVVLRAHLESLGPAAPHADQLVFAAPGGGPLGYSHWRHRVWLPAAAAAGVPGAGFHDLRRANATALVAAGVDIKTAQTRLGHSDPRLTLTIYARAVPEADRAAAEALGARFFMPSSPVSPVPPG